MLGKNFSRRHFEIFFLFFFSKWDLTLHANCLLGDNLHDVSESVCRKNKKHIVSLSSAEFAHSMVSVDLL